MKEDFSNNELEKRLKQEADRFTLPPSDEVWNRINKQLHPRRDRRTWLWAAIGLLVLSVGAYFLLRHQVPPDNISVVSTSSQPDHANAENTSPTSAAGTAPSSEMDNARSGNQEVAASGKSIGQASESSHGAADRTSEPRQSRQPQTARATGQPREGAASAAVRPTDLTGIPSLSWFLPVTAPDIPAAEIPLLPVFPGGKEFSLVKTTVEPDEIAESEKTTAVKKKRKAVFEIFYTAGKGYRKLMVPDHPSSVMQMENVLSGFAVVKDNKIDQKPDWNFSVGVRGIFPLGKKWDVETGLSLIRTGYEVRAFGTYPAYIRTNDNYALSAPVGQVNSFFATSSFAAIQQQKPAYIHNRYLYGELPLLIRRSFGRPEKIHFDLALGGGLLYLLNSSPVIFSPQSGRYFVDKKMLQPFNVNLHAEADVIVPLSRKLNFTIGPSMQYQLFSTYKDYPQVKEHPYFPGIKAGLQWLK